MANYWDTFKPGLLAGEDYWEDFTPEAPTETGVVGKVTGKRYQPWEKGYHNIAGLVDDSGEYDAWYDPDPPPETSRPDWGTPEGYDNWKNRIALETGSGSGSNSGVHLPEGGSGDPTHQSWTLGTNKQNLHDSWGGTPWQDIPGLSKLGESLGWNKVASAPITDDATSSSGPLSLSNILGTVNITNALFAGMMSGGNPLAMIAGGLGFKGITSILNGTHPAVQDTAEVTIEETGVGQGTGNTTGGDPDLEG